MTSRSSAENQVFYLRREKKATVSDPWTGQGEYPHRIRVERYATREQAQENAHAWAEAGWTCAVSDTIDAVDVKWLRQ